MCDLSFDKLSLNDAPALKREILFTIDHPSIYRPNIFSSRHSQPKHVSSGSILSFSDKKASKLPRATKTTKTQSSSRERATTSLRKSDPDDKKASSSKQIRTRSKANSEEKASGKPRCGFYRVGGKNLQNKLMNTICMYKTDFSESQFILKMPRKIEHFCAEIGRFSDLQDEIFVAGGRSEAREEFGTNNADIYFMTEKKRLKLDPLFVSRYKGSVAKLDNYYYVCGGYNRFPLTSVESYEVILGSHHRLPDMNYARAGFQVVTMDSAVYAIGGSRNFSLPIEFYDPRAPDWEIVSRSHSPVPIYNASVQIINNIFFVSTHQNFLSYDSVAAKWRVHSNSISSTRNHQSFVYRDCFYKVSGFRRSTLQPAYSFYEPTIEEWNGPFHMCEAFGNGAMFYGAC